MIDAARNDLDEGKIDSYSMAYASPGYRVTVVKGKKEGAGAAATEEKAYAMALAAMNPEPEKKT